MKHIKIDSILLFALVIPFIMTYRIGPSDTPYWLFGFIFLELLVYLALDLLKISEKVYFRIKQIILYVIVISAVGSGFISAIIVRHQVHPIYKIHDMPLQQEAAIRFLLDGKNPYTTSYFGTFLEEWHYSDIDKNPALYHFVLPPLYILSALPFYFLSNQTVGYFDARIPILAFFAGLIVFASILVKDQKNRLLFLILLTFNPALLPYMLEGRSDMFMFPFLFFGFFLLYYKKYIISAIPMALAFAIKQSAWPLFPFYLGFLYFKTKNIKKVLINAGVFAVLFLAVTAPFFLWDARAFMESTIFYLSGTAEHSYPISGYGLGMLLKEFGFIKDVKIYYPFIIWQIIIGIPLFIVLIRYLKDNPSIKALILTYGIFLFVYWYLSRYFNNSHLGYLSLVFITAYFWPEENEKTNK